MGFGVGSEAERRGHVDSSFDKFGFFDVRGGGVAALEFGAVEAIAVLQGNDRDFSCGARGRSLVGGDHMLGLGWCSDGFVSLSLDEGDSASGELVGFGDCEAPILARSMLEETLEADEAKLILAQAL